MRVCAGGAFSSWGVGEPAFVVDAIVPALVIVDLFCYVAIVVVGRRFRVDRELAHVRASVDPATLSVVRMRSPDGFAAHAEERSYCLELGLVERFQQFEWQY